MNLAKVMFRANKKKWALTFCVVTLWSSLPHAAGVLGCFCFHKPKRRLDKFMKNILKVTKYTETGFTSGSH